jgi:hypothetical protein
MALTLEAEQRLGNMELIKFFVDNEAVWEAVAKETYAFVKGKFPKSSKVRPDDVAKFLIPVLEVDTGFRNRLDVKPLRGKFWISDFADLIIDRTWARISN